jgi:Domain of unknown function (DUF5698)
MSHVGDALTLMMLSMFGVGLWTMRVTLAASRRKLLTSGVAAIEAVVFVVSFSRLATDLDRPARLVGYAAGVALGTMIGLTVTDAMTNRPGRASDDESDRARRRDGGRPTRQPCVDHADGPRRSENGDAGRGHLNVGERAQARLADEPA